MKLLKKMLIGALIAAFTAQIAFAASGVITFDENSGTAPSYDSGIVLLPAAPGDETDLNAGTDDGDHSMIQPYDIEPVYMSVTGTVTMATPFYTTGNEIDHSRYFITIEQANGGIINFQITADSANITGEAPAVGDTFTGFYNGNLPVMMIYPPQYMAVAYAVNLELDEYFVPENGNIPVMVEGKTIEAPAPFLNENGMLMVPVRAIAEALDFKVTWEAETQTVYLNNAYSLSIGNDGYIVGRRAPTELGTAPALINGRTYVPLNFFRDILQMNNAYYFEGSVVIDNGEKME